MFRSSRFGSVAAGVVVALTASAGMAAEGDPRIATLERRIAQLESQQAAHGRELAATIDAVLRDAERRSQVLAGGGQMGAGYDNGFFIGAGDEWVLRPSAHFQFRNVSNYVEDADDEAEDDWENGFELRRVRFEFAGSALTRDLTYNFQWEANRDGPGVTLLEAWGKYMVADDWGARAGQFKSPVTHEFLMSPRRTLAVDTSMVDALIGGGVTGYTQGVMLVYGNYSRDNPLYIEAGFTDGANQANTDVTDRTDLAPAVPGKHTVEWGIAGRAEWKLMGEWPAYADFTAKGTREDLLVAGAGADWTQAGDGNLVVASADVQYENPSGLGAYGAVIYNHPESELAGFDSAASNWGVLVQGSYLVTGNWEVFARYDVTLFDDDRALMRGGVASGEGQDTFHEITAGVNYYMGAHGAAGHRAKFTVDVSYLPDGSPRPISGLGILDDNGGQDEWIVRAQFQLLI